MLKIMHNIVKETLSDVKVLDLLQKRFFWLSDMLFSQNQKKNQELLTSRKAASDGEDSSYEVDLG